jgi:type II secretory pathway pseudopilin PulG
MHANRRRRPALTLIEIIVVIAIITVLMTLTVAMGQYMVRQAMYRQVEDLLVSLDQATLRYKNDWGIWPYQYDSNNDGLPDNTTTTAVHELTRVVDDNGGRRQRYFEGDAQTLRLRDPFTSNRTVYNAATQGYYAVYDPFESNATDMGSAGGVHVHGWDNWDDRVRRNHLMPFWHSRGPDGAGETDNRTVYSTCFAW